LLIRPIAPGFIFEALSEALPRVKRLSRRSVALPKERDVRLPTSLIQRMLQSGFYPHPVTEPIKLIQTHIFVLLTGDYAINSKKPVNFSF